MAQPCDRFHYRTCRRQLDNLLLLGVLCGQSGIGPRTNIPFKTPQRPRACRNVEVKDSRFTSPSYSLTESWSWPAQASSSASPS